MISRAGGSLDRTRSFVVLSGVLHFLLKKNVRYMMVSMPNVVYRWGFSLDGVRLSRKWAILSKYRLRMGEGG